MRWRCASFLGARSRECGNEPGEFPERKPPVGWFIRAIPILIACLSHQQVLELTLSFELAPVPGGFHRRPTGHVDGTATGTVASPLSEAAGPANLRLRGEACL